MKTRAAVLASSGIRAPYAESKPLRVEELELAPPGEGEALVRITSAGLCHSDVGRIDGSRPRPMPMVIGHEAAGIVQAVGAGVKTVKPGNKVILTFVPACGRCSYCARGRRALCTNANASNANGTLVSGATRFSRGRQPVFHHSGVSGFSEYTVVAVESLIVVPDDTPMEIAAVFGCAAVTGIGAVMNRARVAPGETVAIFGGGGVGLMALLGAVVSGASEIVLVDPVAGKRALARSLGATLTIDPRADDPVAVIREATGGGVDYAFEASGYPRVLEQAYYATARGGTAIAVGLAETDATFPIPQLALVYEERALLGTFMGSANPLRDIPRYVALWRKGKLPVERLVSATFQLDDINAALDELLAGEALRTVCTFS